VSPPASEGTISTGIIGTQGTTPRRRGRRVVCRDRPASELTGVSVRALRREPSPPTPRRRNLATGMTVGALGARGAKSRWCLPSSASAAEGTTRDEVHSGELHDTTRILRRKQRSRPQTTLVDPVDVRGQNRALPRIPPDNNARFLVEELILSVYRTDCPDTGQMHDVTISMRVQGSGPVTRPRFGRHLCPPHGDARRRAARPPAARVRACTGQHRAPVRSLREAQSQEGPLATQDRWRASTTPIFPPDDLSVEAENRSRATGWVPGHR
jgi:hypothetical protein